MRHGANWRRLIAEPHSESWSRPRFRFGATRWALSILPVPPSINHQYATVNGRRLLSATGRSYKSLVSEHVMVALSQAACRDTLLRSLQKSELILSIWFFFTSRLRRDVDGGLKIAQDALPRARYQRQSNYRDSPVQTCR